MRVRTILLGRRFGDFRQVPNLKPEGCARLEAIRHDVLPSSIKKLYLLRPTFSDQLVGFPAQAKPLCGSSFWARATEPGDAGLVCGTNYAVGIANGDCPMVCFWQGERLAVLHAGYRCLVREDTTTLNIIDRALQAGFDPSRTCAWIGFGIGPCCWEPSEERAPELHNPSGHHEQHLVERCRRRTPITSRTSGRWTIDLYALARQILERAGIPTSQITVQDECTCCATKDGELLYWSHARAVTEGSVDGRNLAIAWLEE